MKKNKKNAVIAVAGISALIIGSSFAFFMDQDAKTNSFTVGNVSISTTEPNWDPSTGTNITPNKVIKKDPTITNTGINDAYAFISVKVPRANVETAKDDGTLVAAKVQDLFTYTVNSDWKLIKTNTSENQSEYIYAYENADGTLKTLKKSEKTTTLFDNVKFINIVDEQESGTDQNIEVNGVGIQTADLGTTDPLEIYNIAIKQGK